MKNTAVIYATKFEDKFGYPTCNGEPDEQVELVAKVLDTVLLNHPEQWDYARGEFIDVLMKHESRGRTVWRWAMYICCGLITALALFGSVCLGLLLSGRLL